MLTSLSLQNFALITHHELTLADGFNVITGETGAGKSLILDALSLCAGGRADTSMVRHGNDSADIYAQFDIDTPISAKAIKPEAIDQKESHQNGIDSEDFVPSDMPVSTDTPSNITTWFSTQERQFDGEILIRRQLSHNGRSKAWLNGMPISLTELKELGALLVNIHSQHAQQALLKPQFVVTWLDSMAGLTDLSKQVAKAYQSYLMLKRQADTLTQQEAQRHDRIELLQSQLADIAPLLAVNYNEIEAEHEELSNLEALMSEAGLALSLLDNDSGVDEPDVMSLLGRAIKLCDNQASLSHTFSQASEMLYLAQQQVSEASALLADYAEQQLPDPERLQELNNLMSLGHQLSRKHKLPASELIQEAQEWQAKLEELQAQPSTEALQQKIDTAWQDYLQLATELSAKRQVSAPTISEQLIAQLKPLALPNARCEFIFLPKDDTQYNGQGIDDIELMFSANVGMPMQPLYKIASGGELSRMALVMQVLLATSNDSVDNQTVPAKPLLVFDEVDVGISGATAQVVGELLRQLGMHRQLLAITHQAQVAAQAHQHILVQKHHDEAQTTSEIKILTGDTQVDELARMSGGVNITDITREHARSLLVDVVK